jgi:hypothetical protein
MTNEQVQVHVGILKYFGFASNVTKLTTISHGSLIHAFSAHSDWCAVK